MRMTGAAALAAIGAILACGSARADVVPPFQGNDTGGIISYTLAAHADIRVIAADHCAQYGKVAKFLATQNTYGGYSSFSCRWVPAGSHDRPLRVRY